MEVLAQKWPVVMLGNIARVEELLEPLVVDYSFFQRPSVAYSVEDVWDGENVNTKIVERVELRSHLSSGDETGGC